MLVKFTYRIDLDLDGFVTPNDASIFGTNYSEGDTAYWAIGDVDYDGIFTPNDAAIFGTTTRRVAAAGVNPNTPATLRRIS